MIPQYFRVSQHYFLQHYYKAYLEFNLDNRFAIAESLSLQLQKKKKIHNEISPFHLVYKVTN